jgi:hypothetical protein
MDAWSQFQPLLTRIFPADGVVDIGKLTPAYRNVYWAWCYQIAVENGGHSSFFYNPSGEFSGETVQALCDIGAPEFGAILAEAISLFPMSEVPRDIDERNEVFQSLSAEAHETMEQLDGSFFGIGSDILMIKMAKYAV